MDAPREKDRETGLTGARLKPLDTATGMIAEESGDTGLGSGTSNRVGSGGQLGHSSLREELWVTVR